MPRVHLLVSCASLKTRPVPARLRLGGVPLRGRAAAWVRRLTSAKGDPVPAADLYKGGHWRAAVAAAANASRAWVLSAGYGLVPFDAPLHGYSATFTPGDADAVAGDPAAWWDALAAWEGPAPGEARRVADVARDPEAFLLVVASAAYLRALSADVREASRRAPGRVAVVCGGAGPTHPLADVLLPCDARLQRVVGGALAALNARVARKLLAEVPAERWAFDVIRDRLAGWLAGVPAATSPARAGVDDEAVLAFVRRELTAAPGASATALLRELRGRGLACEQRRFARLYRAAAAGVRRASP